MSMDRLRKKKSIIMQSQGKFFSASRRWFEVMLGGSIISYSRRDVHVNMVFLKCSDGFTNR